ncbi:hypothetical protein HJG60_009936 [Phyllostomus discolor]|uniref:Uncharacterized protein n=1 Tax=Phyllostomus discolor TaxID=89673 RepID=A0A834B772_9CHIR|nr:hypothetical protein HJG60_009936 [Phyllostomus discolor]
MGVVSGHKHIQSPEGKANSGVVWGKNVMNTLYILVSTCRNNDNNGLHFSSLPCMYTDYSSCLLLPFHFYRVCGSQRVVINFVFQCLGHRISRWDCNLIVEDDCRRCRSLELNMETDKTLLCPPFEGRASTFFNCARNMQLHDVLIFVEDFCFYN